MGWEFSDVVRFDPGLLLQGQTKIAKFKNAYNLFIIGYLFLALEFWDGKLSYRVSWPGNGLMWSDLTLGSSY